MTQNTDYAPLWAVDLICCGREEGHQIETSWEAADAFRRSYIAAEGHERQGIVHKVEGTLHEVHAGWHPQGSLPRMIRTCDSCAQTGEVTVEGDAYVCRTCHNEYDEAIREVARIHNTTPMTVRRIVEDYFRELDRVRGRKPTSESEA